MTFQTVVNACQSMGQPPVEIVNTSPGKIKPKLGLGPEDVIRGLRIGIQLSFKAQQRQPIIVFGSTHFQLYVASYLAWLKRLWRIPILVTFFGSNSYDVIAQLNPKKREVVLSSLQSLDAVVVETKIAAEGLRTLGLTNTVNIPGFRKIDLMPQDLPCPQRSAGERLRLVFLSQVRREKGIFLLFRALRKLNASTARVTCDVYGPIYPEIEEEFHKACEQTPGASYCGIAHNDIPLLIAGYDALVLPTTWAGEGHPGVVIEAMIAGRPVLATNFRAVPELIEHNHNGLLFEPDSVEGLIDSITYVLDHPDDSERMGRMNRERAAKHDVRRAVERLFELAQIE